MAGGAAQVDQSALGQHDHGPPIGEDELVDLGLDGDTLDLVVVDQVGDIDFGVEVSDVADDGFVLHPLEVGSRDDAAATGGGDEDITAGDDVVHRRHLVTLHGCLQGADRVDFGDHHASPEALHGMGTSLADVSVAADDHDLAGDHDVGGPLDSVSQRLATAVEVVELALGDRVVDVDRRDAESTFLVHLVQTVHSRGGLLGQPLDLLQVFGGLVVDHRGQITAVVEDHVQRAAIVPSQRLLDTPVEFLFAHPFPREDRHVGGGNRGGSVILGGEDIAAGPLHLGSQCRQGFDQDGRLDCHVQATGDPGAGQRLRCTIFLAQSHQARHLVFGQFDLESTPFGQRHVGDLVGNRRGLGRGGGHA